MSTSAVTSEALAAAQPPAMRQRQWAVLMRTTLRQWRARIGLTIFVLMVLIALLGPLFAPHSPDAFVAAPNSPAGVEGLPFGSDSLGRDVWSRFLYGGRTVLGIDGSATVQQTWEQIARIARRTAEAMGLGRDLHDDEIVLLDEWHAGTYGIPDAKTIAAIRLCARLEGVLTDPVYEGKSMAALIDLVRGGRIEPGSRVLYAHLGGQPALSGYAGAF